MENVVFPLSCGLGLFQNSSLCVSVISSEGEKKVGGDNLKPVTKFWDKPFLRGLLYFFYGIILYVKTYLKVFSLFDRPKEEQNKSFVSQRKLSLTSAFIAFVAIAVFSFILALLLFGALPKFIFSHAFPNSENYYFKSFIVALLRASFLILVFVVLRFAPFSNSLYSFNGVGSVYLNERFNGKNSQNSTKRQFCPLNFLNFLLNVFLFSIFMVSLVAIKINFLLDCLINLSIFLVFASICYEVLLFASKTKIAFVKDLMMITNFLVNIKPNITQEEVLKVAEIELKNDNFITAENGKIPMSVVYAEMEGKLKNVERYEKSDVDWIVGTVLCKNRAEIKLIRFVSQKEYREIMRACERRAKGEPLSNIFGFVDFYGLRFDVNKKVLSPRMETEILVENVLKKINDTGAKEVLDLCTGSGAIAITLAKLSQAHIWASDISKQALALAKENAIKNNAKVDFVLSDLFKNLKKKKKYDIIVSNPPYIKTSDIEKLDVEVKKYDPKLALDGGEDGLVFYRQIIKESTQRLNKRGFLFFEIGEGQAKDVKALMQENGFEDITIIKDYNKIERIIYGRISA